MNSLPTGWLRVLLAGALASSSLVACVYSSDAPTPDSSGKTAQSTSGTDPTSSGSTGSTGSSGSSGSSGTDAGSGSGSSGTDSGSSSASTGPTWTNIYAAYFASSSPGRCGASGCHASSKSGVACPDQATCYKTLVSSGYVTPSAASSSPLIDTSQSCLSWFGGNMPPGGSNGGKPATDITAWVKAGALNN